MIADLSKNLVLFLTAYPTLVLDSLTNIKSYVFITDTLEKFNWSPYVSSFLTTNSLTQTNSPEALLELSNTHTPVLKSTKIQQEGSNHELVNDYRFQKTQNPVFKYDFKVGHYLTDNVKVLSRQLFTTFNDTTGGVRKAP